MIAATESTGTDNACEMNDCIFPQLRAQVKTIHARIKASYSMDNHRQANDSLDNIRQRDFYRCHKASRPVGESASATSPPGASLHEATPRLFPVSLVSILKFTHVLFPL